MNTEKTDFTQGSILKKLCRFMLPVLGALILQAAYGAVDLTGRLNRELFGPCDMQTVQPDEWLEKYRAGAAVSPLLQAGPDNVPVTHMQGLNDEIIFPYETAQLHDRLLACGVESRLILLPGQKHSFILFNYQSPNETVQKILDMAGDILAEKGFLR